MNLSLSSLQLISSSCFTNHRCSHITTPTPKSHLPIIRKPCFRVFLSSTHRATPTATTTRKPVKVYLIERLGFSQEQSLSISKKILRGRENCSRANQVNDLISFEIADNVITYLQGNCGLDLSQVKKLITKLPRVLMCDVDKTLKPKIKPLQDLGFSTSDLALVLSANPRLYLQYDLGPAIQALRDIMGSDEGVVQVCKKIKYGSTSNILSNLIPNVAMLINEYGIPTDKMIKFLTKSPKSLVRITESLRDVLVRVEDKWGISRDSTEFLRAIHVFCSNTEDTIDSKCQVFRSYGWSDSDILSLIRRHPECLGLSEATIKKKLEFFVNELSYDPAYLASRPVMLGLSLENRVVPRHRVLSILKGKRLIKADFQLYTVLQFSESKFLDKFIIPFKNVVPKLCEVYANSEESTDIFLHMETSKDETERKVAAE